MFRTSEDYEYFASYIRRESRYVLDARQHEFLETIVETSRKRATTIPQGQVYGVQRRAMLPKRVYTRTTSSSFSPLNRLRSSG